MNIERTRIDAQTFHRSKRKNTMMEWISSYGIGDRKIFLTLNFNKRRSTMSGHALKHFFAMLDRQLIGSRWRKAYECRTDVVCFPENVFSNFHYHCVGTMPALEDDASEKVVEGVCNHYWRKAVPSGTVNFQFITRTPEHLADYVTKQVGKQTRFDDFILSREFWSSMIEVPRQPKFRPPSGGNRLF